MEIEKLRMLAVPHYYTISAPERNAAHLPALIALHGYAGDMTSMLRVAREIAGEDMVIASLQGPHQFRIPSTDGGDDQKLGFGWLTQYHPEHSQARHHLLVQGVIETLQHEFRVDAAQIFLMGFSQACALNYRLAFTRPGLLRGVIGVCGGIPGDFQDPKYQSIAAGVLHIVATQDRYYKVERARLFEPAIRRLASDVTFREYDCPHVFPRGAIPDVREWILARVKD